MASDPGRIYAFSMIDIRGNHMPQNGNMNVSPNELDAKCCGESAALAAAPGRRFIFDACKRSESQLDLTDFFRNFTEINRGQSAI